MPSVTVVPLSRSHNYKLTLLRLVFDPGSLDEASGDVFVDTPPRSLLAGGDCAKRAHSPNRCLTVLVDCGMSMRTQTLVEFYKLMNSSHEVQPSGSFPEGSDLHEAHLMLEIVTELCNDLDAIVITKGSTSHCGLLPILYSKGFANRPDGSLPVLVTTEATLVLARMALYEMWAHFNESEYDLLLEDTVMPLLGDLFTLQDVERALSSVKTIRLRFHEATPLPTPDHWTLPHVAGVADDTLDAMNSLPPVVIDLLPAGGSIGESVVHLKVGLESSVLVIPSGLHRPLNEGRAIELGSSQPLKPAVIILGDDTPDTEELPATPAETSLSKPTAVEMDSATFAFDVLGRLLGNDGRGPAGSVLVPVGSIFEILTILRYISDSIAAAQKKAKHGSQDGRTAVLPAFSPWTFVPVVVASPAISSSLAICSSLTEWFEEDVLQKFLATRYHPVTSLLQSAHSPVFHFAHSLEEYHHRLVAGSIHPSVPRLVIATPLNLETGLSRDILMDDFMGQENALIYLLSRPAPATLAERLCSVGTSGGGAVEVIRRKQEDIDDGTLRQIYEEHQAARLEESFELPTDSMEEKNELKIALQTKDERESAFIPLSSLPVLPVETFLLDAETAALLRETAAPAEEPASEQEARLQQTEPVPGRFLAYGADTGRVRIRTDQSGGAGTTGEGIEEVVNAEEEKAVQAQGLMESLLFARRRWKFATNTDNDDKMVISDGNSPMVWKEELLGWLDGELPYKVTKTRSTVHLNEGRPWVKLADRRLPLPMEGAPLWTSLAKLKPHIVISIRRQPLRAAEGDDCSASIRLVPWDTVRNVWIGSSEQTIAFGDRAPQRQLVGTSFSCDQGGRKRSAATSYQRVRLTVSTDELHVADPGAVRACLAISQSAHLPFWQTTPPKDSENDLLLSSPPVIVSVAEPTEGGTSLLNGIDFSTICETLAKDGKGPAPKLASGKIIMASSTTKARSVGDGKVTLAQCLEPHVKSDRLQSTGNERTVCGRTTVNSNHSRNRREELFLIDGTYSWSYLRLRRAMRNHVQFL